MSDDLFVVEELFSDMDINILTLIAASCIIILRLKSSLLLCRLVFQVRLNSTLQSIFYRIHSNNVIH